MSSVSGGDEGRGLNDQYEPNVKLYVVVACIAALVLVAIIQVPALVLVAIIQVPAHVLVAIIQVPALVLVAIIHAGK